VLRKAAGLSHKPLEALRYKRDGRLIGLFHVKGKAAGLSHKQLEALRYENDGRRSRHGVETAGRVPAPRWNAAQSGASNNLKEIPCDQHSDCMGRHLFGHGLDAAGVTAEIEYSVTTTYK